MTNWIVGHTDAFKAAVSPEVYLELDFFFGTMDIGYFFASDQTGGDFFDNLEGYLRQSPLMSAPNVVTPILFIHSLEDYRCWVPEAMQFYCVEISRQRGQNGAFPEGEPRAFQRRPSHTQRKAFEGNTGMVRFPSEDMSR